MKTKKETHCFSAQRKYDEAKALLRERILILCGTIALCAILCVLDITLLNGPMTSMNYDESQSFIYTMCLACSVAPIICSALAAEFLRGYQCRREGHDTWTLIFGVIMAVGAIGSSIAGWIYRDEYWNDASGLSILLNLTAVISALLAFGVDYHFVYQRILLKAKREEALDLAKALEHLDYLRQFRDTHETDVLRRQADDAQYLQVCCDAVLNGVEMAGCVRRELADRVAQSPEDREHIMATPLMVDGRPVVAGNGMSLLQRACEAVGAPTQEDAEEDWPKDPSNTVYDSLDVASKLRAYEEELHRIYQLGAESLPKADAPKGDDDEIVIEVEPIES